MTTAVTTTAIAGWQWQMWQGLPYLTCELLQPFAHGFFTRHFFGRSPADLTQAIAPEAVAYHTRQVHGRTILTPTDISAADSETPDADGIAADGPHQALWTASADCTPALIADVKTGSVAAVHAGWRGTAQRILPEAIARLEAQGSRRQDLRVALGPAIAGEVYQVGEEVALEVGASLFPEEQDPNLETLWALPETPLLPDPEPGRVRLDVRQVNRLQLLGLGFSDAQVAIAPHCTHQEPERFFSYRRSREKKIQRSGIVSRVL